MLALLVNIFVQVIGIKREGIEPSIKWKAIFHNFAWDSLGSSSTLLLVSNWNCKTETNGWEKRICAPIDPYLVY